MQVVKAGSTEKETVRSARRRGRSRVSSKHQITIPVQALREAGLRAGDVVQIRVEGPGRVVVARLDDLLDEFAGAVRSGGELGRSVRGLRDEWN